MTRYRTIVADPPWRYDEGWPAVSTSPKAADRSFASVVDPRGLDPRYRRPLAYEAMSCEEIANLPVAELAEDDAHLYLWTTNRYIRESFVIAERWGFPYSQVLVWAKAPRGIGPGGTFSQNAEFILFGRRGKLKSLQRLDTVWFPWKRTPHSEKPDAMLDVVEQVSPGPYLEMFARRARFGWDYWGDESLGTAELPHQDAAA